MKAFTLIELMVTLAVAAVVLTVAVPSFRSLLQNNRAATEANELVSALSLARSEAVKRGRQVSVCASSDGNTCSGSTDWSTGWIVFTDHYGTSGSVDSSGGNSDQVIRRWDAPGGSPTLTTTEDDIRFNGLGEGTIAGTGSSVTFTLQLPDCTGNNSRSISLRLPTGRTQVSTSSCP